ncbi:MAG: MBL fold metallo-hydrolase [Treponema sp.]|jgi:glyoxylase-like metal-dependent hydrolase (beta-lactamase superfamily II)|nr:MBL fold metallo-hydrolase [Treponema sp.]
MNEKDKRIIEFLTVGGIETNCWIYSLSRSAGAPGPQPCAVIDPGGDAPRIIAFLREKNLSPAYLLLTHGHFDHLAALPDLAAAFTDAVVAVHRDDRHYLGPGAYAVHRDTMTAAGGGEAYVKSLWKPLLQAAPLLSDGDSIGPFTVIHLPGHTPGSAAFYESEAGVLFSGDTLFSGDYGRTDLPGGDWNRLEQSLKRLLAMDGSITVCPGHGPATSIGIEAARGLI